MNGPIILDLFVDGDLQNPRDVRDKSLTNSNELFNLMYIADSTGLRLKI